MAALGCFQPAKLTLEMKQCFSVTWVWGSRDNRSLMFDQAKALFLSSASPVLGIEVGATLPGWKHILIILPLPLKCWDSMYHCAWFDVVLGDLIPELPAQ